MYRLVRIESQEQQQQEETVNFNKKQVKNMEEHADRNQDAADILFNRAQQRKADGDDEGSLKASSESGHQYIMAAEKILKANLVANNMEDSTYKGWSNGKPVEKKLLETHSAFIANRALGNKRLLTDKEVRKLDNIKGKSGLDYISLEYTDGDEDPISLTLEACTTKKELCEKVFSNYKTQKSEHEKKQKQRSMVEFLDTFLDDTLGYGASK